MTCIPESLPFIVLKWLPLCVVYIDARFVNYVWGKNKSKNRRPPVRTHTCTNGIRFVFCIEVRYAIASFLGVSGKLAGDRPISQLGNDFVR